MRILHLTDTHLGLSLRALGSPPGWSRSDDHARAMAHALEPALREEVELVLHTGDLFDRSRPTPAAMASAAELLRQVARRVPVVVMPGNHDRHGLSRSLPAQVPNLHIVDQPATLSFGELRLGLVPYLRQAEDWALAAGKLGPVDLLLAHQAFDGARVPGWTFRAGRQGDTIGEQHLPRGVRWILCGHIHPRQRTRLGDSLVVQPGSTERSAFAEQHETKGYALWELSREIRHRFVDLPSRPMRSVSEPSELEGLEPGSLVRTALPPEPLLERGLWVVPVGERAPERAPERAQLGLFSRG